MTSDIMSPQFKHLVALELKRLETLATEEANVSFAARIFHGKRHQGTLLRQQKLPHWLMRFLSK